MRFLVDTSGGGAAGAASFQQLKVCRIDGAAARVWERFPDRLAGWRRAVQPAFNGVFRRARLA